MLSLASNAKKRGDGTAALGWYEKAYTTAEGAATRLQWGAIYVDALVELSPTDSKRIERATSAIIAELEVAPDTFHGRNRRALERIGRKLAGWNRAGERRQAVQRVTAQLTAVCNQLPSGDASRTNCEAALNPGPRPAA